MNAAVPAVILAAGSGRRMGKGPKALLDLDGRTFLAHVAACARDGGCRPVVAVIPPGFPELATHAEDLADHTVINPHPERGMFASVQLGIQTALGAAPAAAACLLFPVDHPRVRPATVRALLERLGAGAGPDWIRPVHRGRGGHPVLLSAGAARALAACDPATPLRDALRSLGYEPADVAVGDPGILVNLNEPNDLKQ